MKRLLLVFVSMALMLMCIACGEKKMVQGSPADSDQAPISNDRPDL